jgi:hypothetical protein
MNGFEFRIRCQQIHASCDFPVKSFIDLVLQETEQHRGVSRGEEVDLYNEQFAIEVVMRAHQHIVDELSGLFLVELAKEIIQNK